MKHRNRLRKDQKRLRHWRWCLCVTLTLLPSVLLAPPAIPPAWWASRSATNAATSDDYAAANIGQLKHFASKAVAELNAWLPAGAGTTLTGMIAQWTAQLQQQTPPGPSASDYSAVNIGQLKTVAKPFYDRLIAVGYANRYPWTAPSPNDADFAIANLGQLKQVFNFGPTVDTDGDGIPDWWETKYGLNLNDPNDASVAAPGGITYLQKYQHGLDPTSPDSDGDGYSDGQEIAAGTNPNDSADHPAGAPDIAYSAEGVALVSSVTLATVGIGAGTFHEVMPLPSYSDGGASVFLIVDPDDATQTITITDGLNEEQIAKYEWAVAMPTERPEMDFEAAVWKKLPWDDSTEALVDVNGTTFRRGSWSIQYHYLTEDIINVETGVFVRNDRIAQVPGPPPRPPEYVDEYAGAKYAWGEYKFTDLTFGFLGGGVETTSDEFDDDVRNAWLTFKSDTATLGEETRKLYYPSPGPYTASTSPDGQYATKIAFWIKTVNGAPAGAEIKRTYLKVTTSSPSEGGTTAPPVVESVQLTIPKEKTTSPVTLLVAAPGKTVSLLPVDIAIDANRDGTIASGESASQAKPFRFWINNDSDSGGNDSEVEGSPPDSHNATIENRRDLEDFQLMKVQIPQFIFEKAMNEETKIGLKWKNVTAGNPGVKVYKVHHEISEAKDYVWNWNKAQMQSDPFGFPLGAYSHAEATVAGGGVSWLSKDALWRVGTTNSQHPYLLFEGGSTGQGQLCLVLEIGGTVVEGPGVWLKLVDVKKMFDKAKGSPASYPNPPDYTTEEPQRPGTGFVQEDMTEPFEADPDEKDEAIVLVHGWNMTDADWRVFSSSFFKRLWWKGYKGRFYTFGWPTYNSDDDTLGFIPAHYNKSEYVAWKYGPALKAFVASIPKTAKNLAAHSMGNVVTASALRSGMTVNSYVAMQAAIPAGCYDASDGANNYQDFLDADAIKPTPDQANPDLGYRGLMAGITGNFHNFFSANDYALKTGEILGGSVSWEGNQVSYKPNRWFNLYYLYHPSAGPAQRNRLWNSGTGGDNVARYVTDHHEIMSFIARPRSEALGARNVSIAGFTGFDLVTEIPQYGFGQARTEHSGQFQRPIQKTEVFYKMLLRKMGVQFNDDN